MYLQIPYAYLVSYELKYAHLNEVKIIEELKRSAKWCHHLPRTWLVLRNETIDDFSQKIRALIYQEDRLLILPAKGPAEGWLPQEAWGWINTNVPKEW